MLETEKHALCKNEKGLKWHPGEAFKFFDMGKNNVANAKLEKGHFQKLFGQSHFFGQNNIFNLGNTEKEVAVRRY